MRILGMLREEITKAKRDGYVDLEIAICVAFVPAGAETMGEVQLAATWPAAALPPLRMAMLGCLLESSGLSAESPSVGEVH